MALKPYSNKARRRATPKSRSKKESTTGCWSRLAGAFRICCRDKCRTFAALCLSSSLVVLLLTLGNVHFYKSRPNTAVRGRYVQAYSDTGGLTAKRKVWLNPEVHPFVDVDDFSLTFSGEEKIQCGDINSQPPVIICMYDGQEDVWISSRLQNGGAWEAEMTEQIINALNQDPEIGFIDVGANLGSHALPVAKMGRRVLAVEPFEGNFHRLHKAIKLNHLEDRMILVRNSISNRRAYVSFSNPMWTNKGGVQTELTDAQTDVRSIFMDDLVPLIGFQKAVMKIDIELHEPLAMAHSEKLFQKVDISHIFMEWHFRDKSSLYPHLKKMVPYLLSLGYQPLSNDQQVELDVSAWDEWTEDVVWVKSY